MNAGALVAPRHGDPRPDVRDFQEISRGVLETVEPGA